MSLIGAVGLAAALAVLGLLSRRLGQVTRARPFYRGIWAAAALVFVGGVAQAVADWVPGVPTLTWVLTGDGLMATGATLGLVLAWRYWSWLIAERD